MSNLDELIAATLAASKPQGCWASHLTGDAADYVAAMMEAEASGRYGKVSRTAMSRVLAKLGVKVSEKQVRSHMTGICSCPK